MYLKSFVEVSVAKLLELPMNVELGRLWSVDRWKAVELATRLMLWMEEARDLGLGGSVEEARRVLVYISS